MSWFAEQAQAFMVVLGFLGLAVAIGYLLPPRWDPLTILCVAAVIAAAWWLFDGSVHNDPWPFIITPGGIGIIAGVIVRRVGGIFRGWRARSNEIR